MKPFCHLANEVIENIDEIYPTKKGPLDIKTVATKTPKDSKKILGNNYLSLAEE